MKFNTHHFPVGTQFTLSPDFAFMHRMGTMEVKSIVRNGPQSFILETTTPKDSTAFNEGTMESYNVAHVDSIVKRGEGKVELTDQPYDSNMVESFWDNMQYTQNEYRKVLNFKKNQVVVNTAIFLELHFFYGVEEKFDQSVDYDKALKLFRKTFGPFSPAKETTTLYLDSFLIVSVKRLKKWFKVNHNRFLGKLKIQAKILEGIYDRSMEEAFDRDFDDQQYDTEQAKRDIDHAFNSLLENSAGIDGDGEAIEVAAKKFIEQTQSEVGFDYTALLTPELQADLDALKALPFSSQPLDFSGDENGIVSDGQEKPFDTQPSSNEKGNPDDF